MNNKSFIAQLMESSSSDSDDDYLINNHLKKQNNFSATVEILSKQFTKRKRVCIENYMDEVVNNYSEDEFKRHFRISISLFDSVTQQFEMSDIYKNMRLNSRGISPKAHMAVFLWFAGHEACSFRDVADRFNLSLSSINRIITRIIKFLSNMSPSVIVWPNTEKKQESSAIFKDKCGFPSVIGCIDGTHIVIDPPKERKDDYIDRKGNVTLVMQAVCNERKKFIDIFVGYPGSSHDSWVLKNSPLYVKLENTCGNYYLLGDSAYPCIKNIMTPYKDNGRLTSAQINFNTKLGSGRVAIEHSFGILKQRFRQLYYCKLRGSKRLCHFIRACCVLHNIANEDDLNFLLESSNEVIAQFHPISDNENGSNLRNQICSELPRYV